MVAGIFLRIFVYGVPLILIILGVIAYTGGKFAELIFETSASSVILGIALILSGLIIFAVEFRFGIR